MDFALESAQQIEALETEAVVERLQYVARALEIIKGELAGRAALLGFAGSPWTLANFMMEGGSAKEFTKARALFQSNPTLFNRLMGKLATAVAAFCGCKSKRAWTLCKFLTAWAVCCRRRNSRRRQAAGYATL